MTSPYVSVPLGHGGPGGAGKVTARDHRLAMAALAEPAITGVGSITGVLPGKSMFQHVSTSGMTMTFEGGAYLVHRPDQGIWVGQVTGRWSVTAAPLRTGDGSSRIDNVVLRTADNDPEIDGTAGVIPAQPLVLQGEGQPPAGQLFKGPTLGPGDVPILYLSVGSGPSISTEFDLRHLVTARGAPRINRTGSFFAPAYDGQLQVNLSTSPPKLQVAVGGSWSAGVNL